MMLVNDHYTGKLALLCTECVEIMGGNLLDNLLKVDGMTKEALWNVSKAATLQFGHAAKELVIQIAKAVANSAF